MPRTRIPAPDLQLVPVSTTPFPTFSELLRRHLEAILDSHACYQKLALRVAVDPAVTVNPLQSAPMQVATFMHILNSSTSMHMQSMQKLLLDRQNGVR